MQTALIKLPDFGSEIRIPEAWVVKRDDTLALAEKIRGVHDQTTFDCASDVLARITKCSNELEKERKKFVKPFNAVAKTIKQVCDNERTTLEEAKRRLKALCAEYAEKQRIKAEEERRKAEEAVRKEAERQFAEQQAAADLGLNMRQPEITVPETAPPTVEEAHSSSSRVTRRLIWRLEDEAEIPRAFLTLDTRKVNEYMRNTKESMMDMLEKGASGTEWIPGIKFEIKTDVQGR
jgi:uncharacterized membrane-anchored protein YhcB (DUF1043 family)